MNRADSTQQAQLRRELRAWLEANRPQDLVPRDAESRVAFLRAWQRRLYEGGWTGIDWPVAYGGRALSAAESLVFQEEYQRAGAPDLIHLSVGPSLVGPTLIARGADWQKQRFLEPILSGDEIWCQGFSEPDAGSDLAALRTRGELHGDEIVVTGQKIWTSFAAHSDWCILVVRSDPNSKRHAGLSFLLVDMRSPGIEVRPLREMTGEAWFNQVFFQEVRVPIENLVGELHRGWEVILTTLGHERGSSAQHAKLGAELERLLALARRTPRERGARRAADDPRLRQVLARIACDALALRVSAYRCAGALDQDGSPGPEGSTLKLAWSDLDQRLKEAAIAVLGDRGLVARGDPLAGDADDGEWAYQSLWSRASTIYAGSSEVQRDILARRVLGLPRSRWGW